MRAIRVAAALCVVLLAAGAEAGAALNKSPSTDASLLRESLLASSKATKRANEAARAVRANGADGLFDGIFADARQHLTPGKRSADATDDADAADDADASRLRLSAAQRRLLWGGWRDDAAAAAPAPAPADASVSAMGGTTADHTSGDAADHASAPAPAPAANITSTPRGFLANALLLNRLRAVLAGEEGAARSLVASAALTSALRNLDPATSLFGRIVEDVAARREAAQQQGDTDVNITPAPAPAPADEHLYEHLDARVAEAISAAFRDAADDRARELLAELFLARLGATGVSVDADDADDGTEGTLLERLDLATLEGLSAAELEANFGAALDAGFEGMRLADVLAGSGSSGSSSGPSGAEQQRLAAEAYRALFAASLDAAGDFVKERFQGGEPHPHSGAEPVSNGTDLTGADLNALLSATVEAAEANAASFVDLGFGPGSDLNATGDGSPTDLSPEAAVALLDRVHGVLAAARGDFTAALAEARDAEGAPLAWPGVAPGDDADTERRGFLSASEIVALIGGARFAQDASLRDVGVAFTVSDDTARLGDLEALDDAFVDAMSGPPSASENVAPNAAVFAADGEETKKKREKPVHERIGFQVGFPVAVVALAAIVVAVRASGHGDRAFAAAARPGESGPDATAGASTAVASGSGSVVRRTSTSTKIEM